MSDQIESPNRNPQTQDLPPLQDLNLQSPKSAPIATTMAESEPQSGSTAADAAKFNISFSIWPPSERTREAVRNRLIETLSAPSILSKRYGTIPHEEAVDEAKRIEEEAFVSAGDGASTDDDGIEILQVYSKDISKRMLETVKSRSGGSAAQVTSAENKAEEEDAVSTAPPQSEKTESVTDYE